MKYEVKLVEDYLLFLHYYLSFMQSHLLIGRRVEAFFYNLVLGCCSVEGVFALLTIKHLDTM